MHQSYQTQFSPPILNNTEISQVLRSYLTLFYRPRLNNTEKTHYSGAIKLSSLLLE